MSDTPTADDGPVAMMDYFMQLDYHELLCPVVRRFSSQLLEGRLVGHKCPSCGLVYVPPRGYCPICVVPTTDADEVVLSDRGTVTNYTVVTPVQYYGQQETEPFVHASVLLDGADTPLNGMDIVGIPHDQLRMGLRVKAIWKPEGERTAQGISNRGWGGLGSVVSAFEPTGEPDATDDVYREHIF